MYRRYVAIGDSSTEGLDDPLPDSANGGRGGYRGWADRLAGHIARHQGSLLYANLGIRGRRTRQVRDEQLGPALAMRPDLVTYFSGTNDVIRRRFDLAQVASDVEEIQRALVGSGATVLTFTLPDLSPVMPIGRLASARVAALNRALREIAADTGALLVDLAEHPVSSDPRLWSADRIHANSAGHERMAAALAHALELPGSGASWSTPLPQAAPRSAFERARAEAAWLGRYFLPWAWRHFWGRSSGDGVSPKRAELLPVAADGGSAG